jgi:hypothetical protein
MSVVLNFKLSNISKLSHITETLNKNFSVSLFEINDKRVCKAVILTHKTYNEIKEIFVKNLMFDCVEFISVRNYFD